MKPNHFISPINTLLASFILLSHLAFAQTKSQITDVFIFGGGMFIDNPELSRQELLLLAPNSPLLNQDLSKYLNNNSRYNYSGTQGTSNFSAMLGFKPFQSKPNRSVSPIVRVGLSFGQVNFVNQSFGYSDRFPYDTLISQRTGEKIYLDSLAGSTLFMQQNGNHARVEIALLYETSTDRWVSVYGGLSLGAGITFNNQTQISQSNYNYNNNVGYGYSYNSYQYEWETYQNKNGYLVQTAIPIGMNIRLGKKKAILNQSSYFIEFSPGLAVYQIPELKTYTNFTFLTSAGLRFRI
jgi:hypothetical protein